MANGDDAKNAEDRLYSLPAGAMCGGCEIVRPLGAGGYAEVYLAVDASGEPCAVKRMQLADRKDQETRYRFLQEAKILSHVRHPNVVGCDDYGADADGTLWMKLEYLEGVTIRERLHTHGTFPIEHVLRLGRQACQGLQELHAVRAAHRDVKPENLFLIEEIDLLKVLDFGLVKLPGSGLRTTGRIALGTALYFAPDYLERDRLAHGDDPDPRWDVYSLGITLYEMMAGHPFELKLGKLPATMVAASMHLHHEIPELSEQGIPGWIAAPIMKALSRSPDERFPDGAAFEAALREVHEKWLGQRAGETRAPRTTSARVRLGHATTEPEVVAQLTRGVATARPAAEAEGSKGRAAELEASQRRATEMEASQRRATEMEASKGRATGYVGPQVTERMFVPPARVLAPDAVTPSPAVHARARTPAPEVAALRAARSSSARDVGPPLPIQRTERLERAQLGAPLPSPTNGRPREGEHEARAIGSRDAASIARTAPPNEHRTALPVSDAERDAAELGVWLRKGYLPPEVAAKLGLRVVAASVPQASAAAGVAAPARARRAPAPGEGPLPAPESPATRSRWRARWEAVARPAAVIVMVALVAALAFLTIERLGLSTPAATAEAGPITVPIVTGVEPSFVPPQPLAAPGPLAAPEPLAPAGGSARAASEPASPASASAASSAAAQSASAAGSAAAQGASAASGAAPQSASVGAATAKPRSSRANDIYPTLGGEDEPGAKPKPAAKPAAAATATAAKPAAAATATAAKPAATATAAPSATTKPPSTMPFGKAED